MNKKSKEYASAKISAPNCGVCKKCEIYIEGPAKGKCVYGGPFKGYESQKKQISEIEEELKLNEWEFDTCKITKQRYEDNEDYLLSELEKILSELPENS